MESLRVDQGRMLWGKELTVVHEEKEVYGEETVHVHGRRKHCISERKEAVYKTY